MVFRRRIEFLVILAGTAASLTLLAGCGDEEVAPDPRRASLVQVQTATDLEEAVRTAVAGDTIQILSGFAGTTFSLQRGLRLSAEQSPILLVGDSRPTVRPRLVFPDSVDGLTIVGHGTVNGRRTTLRYIDIQGGRNGLVLNNARADVNRCTFKGSLLDGIAARGAQSNGRVDLCLLDQNNRFGISTGEGAALTIERNTVARSGDCGLYIDSDAIVRANNVVMAHQFGIILRSHSAGATLTCNNSFGSEIGPNYVSDVIAVDPVKNIELDPRFCGPGLYSVRQASPLAWRNSPSGCGAIGAFDPECD